MNIQTTEVKGDYYIIRLYDEDGQPKDKVLLANSLEEAKSEGYRCIRENEAESVSVWKSVLDIEKTEE